ncbi:PepSY domain-containing protein [Hyphomicrobium sp.]|uniref:PepSY domain-containing protein n=1 Tax=Hyphomicrobium sp. TaxID=82 RepID=UPI002D0BEA66|nr:PepSY domain-containing protein [Hyphomicrobium sp.]HVZ06208.1 PepSY domain-containing protein [Hyphomicrobium sp.]
MDSVSRRITLLLLTALLFAGGLLPAVADDDDHDHELARQALSEGRIRPLTDIIDAFKAKFPGDIVGVELEAKKGKSFVYEFKVVTPDGKLKEVKVDAQTANIIKIEDDD